LWQIEKAVRPAGDLFESRTANLRTANPRTANPDPGSRIPDPE
jgi:hypothetical protein